ncbi:FAD-dependent oxidoreductase [Desulfonema ishimotonii]|uniref:thioredoxin-dependent peroxiredoxin n=1 Tax=Desulfonema ishimotonii TaxID=45657 RepID=A0A401G1D2_9BACT|nr:redoxin domain-containing protein [Desulfonema ishimotonii]GBC63007.1 FAD-dependent oxidoreductase [Desulfonema ishimotonii]
MTLAVTEGRKAPDFSLKNKDGKTVRLSDFAGKRVVLYFYPRDNTKGCTTEARDFTALRPGFEEKGAVIIGISPDSEASHLRFADKHGIEVELLSDPDHRVSEAYGVWQQKKIGGREFMGVVRSTVLISPDGIIEKIWEKVRVKHHADDVRAALCERADSETGGRVTSRETDPAQKRKAEKGQQEYDVIIVGGGPAGLFSAFYLVEHSDCRVLLIEKGHEPGKRKCPIGETQQCVHCSPCNILCGIGGAGLFSDGKLNYIPRLGKTDLTQFMSRSQAQALIDETEAIYNRFGMDGPVYPTNMPAARAFRKNAKKYGIDLLLIKQKHLGSDCLPGYIANMGEYIKSKGAAFQTFEEVEDLIVEDDAVRGVVTRKKRYLAKNVILAPGRVGAEWVSKIAQKYDLGLTHRGIEVGVRVEVHNDIMQDLCEVIYDPTFFIQTRKYDDQTRTFCTNFGGYVSQENYRDFVCVNGHAFRDRKSENTNFAFLSKVILTEPVTDNQAYGEAIGGLASLIGGGKPILQRFGDLIRGRRSTWNRISKGYIEPTLTNVVCGDIAMALPERILTNLVEGLEKLNHVVPGVTNDGTLLYAPEIKFFATQVETSADLQTRISGLYVAGDGPGVAGNIVSASATGLIPAKAIISSP